MNKHSFSIRGNKLERKAISNFYFKNLARNINLNAGKITGEHNQKP